MNFRKIISRAGVPYPLGATWDGEGVNFALFSENASKVMLCIFDETGKEELLQVALPAKTDHVWHGYFRGLCPGTIYGYRVFGHYDPHRGMRFNPNKLLIDPYARCLCGTFKWVDEHFGYTIGDASCDLSFDTRDNARFTYKGKVIDNLFNWENDRNLNIPWKDTIIYELHVRGFSKLNPAVPEEIRGTYTGLAHPASIKHLKKLGISAVEIMPVHAFIDERCLVDKGLTNYWGYNSIQFFSPTDRYAATDNPVNEFKSMVKALHSAGIEVILDVVYNHTAEGNHFGPTLSFRGIDNASYYRLVSPAPRYYMDYTGCGNTVNVMNPRTLQLLMDSLRYWVQEMHVDGFRFDLAASLARENHAVDRSGSFFDIIAQDPVLSQVKLIAEPWDIGEGGYQLGNFPVGWTEWNGCYKETVRSFWRSDEGQIENLSRRLTGSSDLYQHSGRSPCASINFISCHDGFTLEDLVSYNYKHNLNNLENNCDGENNNYSWNCGEEGQTNNTNIISLREQQKRNMLVSLLLSHGVPMITSGDELGRTQKGNNNAYCQDNETSWLNWNLNVEQESQFEFVRELIAIRKQHLVFRRNSFTNCLCPERSNLILWLKPDGSPMHETDWYKGYTRSVSLLLPGDTIQEFDSRGRQIIDDSFLIFFNAHWEDLLFTVPVLSGGWKILIDTSRDPRDLRRPQIKAGGYCMVHARSLIVLIRENLAEKNKRTSKVCFIPRNEKDGILVPISRPQNL